MLLNKLIQGGTLTTEEAAQLLHNITNGEMNEAQIVCAITCMMLRDISTEELKGFRHSILEQAIIPELDATNAIDVCGTGGDSKNTFNISTLSAIVIAAAGYKVIKHGNYGVSSFCGSSTILEGLGYHFSNNSEALQTQLNQEGICFLHAPLFHPCLSRVGQIRKDLGVRTFFNFLGPLVNPAQPAYQLTGVYNLKIARMYRDILMKERKAFSIVHSVDGYDEVSLTAGFKLITKTNEELLYPDQIGQEYVAEEALHGGKDMDSAMALFIDLLGGRGTEVQERVVLTNAAFGIQCFNSEKSFEACFEEASEALRTGKALQKITNLIELSNQPLLVQKIQL
ncbi:MAG: anthranilate phosphoribosyltransferase [Crocinitomix sp.]|jgi:anthranilate phosphoribosyltransferase